MAADLPSEPFNREEQYLADIAGQPGAEVPPCPWSRKEAYLDAISGRLSTMDEKIAALATDISLKGSVADYDHLPTNAAIGDAYITEDTGILYVWVGDQWTPLNMQGGGGVKELTTDDYNYPTNNPAYVAMWLLSPGYYTAPSGVEVRNSTANGTDSRYAEGVNFIIGGNSSSNRSAFILSAGSNRAISAVYMSGGYNTYRETRDFAVIRIIDIVDNLTSTDEYKVLSAKQGKVLNDKIGNVETILQTLNSGNGAA